MRPLNRREFLTAAGVGLSAACVRPAVAVPQSDDKGRFAFYVVGDTHYLASKDRTGELDATSRGVTARFVDWLNRLPGSAIPDAAGGGKVSPPVGVVHVGDVIDSGDKNTGTFPAMQKTEWRAFEEDFGLTGKDGRLKYPVYEVHGNHDCPGGTGLAIDEIKRRNKTRPGLVNVSPNGLHYSWDWGGVHFVNLGIVVGPVKEVARKRRYAALDSLPFLTDDLAKNVQDRTRPVILTHHVDVARYSDDPKAEPRNPEWDPADVRGYHDAIKGYNVLAVFYGHTHTRNVFRWDGTKSLKATDGVPVFNNDNGSHFAHKTQAFFYCEVGGGELVVREFATKDNWQTGEWSPTVWRVPAAKA